VIMKLHIKYTNNGQFSFEAEHTDFQIPNMFKIELRTQYDSLNLFGKAQSLLIAHTVKR
jgi:hypothetical protein